MSEAAANPGEERPYCPTIRANCVGRICNSWAPGIGEAIPIEFHRDIQGGHCLRRTVEVYALISANQGLELQRAQLKIIRQSAGLPESEGPNPQ